MYRRKRATSPIVSLHECIALSAQSSLMISLHECIALIAHSSLMISQHEGIALSEQFLRWTVYMKASP